jgi:hypothetical protein
MYVFVLFSVYVAALRRVDPPSKESYRLCIGFRNRKKKGPGPKGCRAIERRQERNMEIWLANMLNGRYVSVSSP